MASSNTNGRRALVDRSVQSSLNHSPRKATRVLSGPFKRPRSPDARDAVPLEHIKRARGSNTLGATLPEREARKDRHAERELRDLQKIEFKEKYTRAFPNWIFHFDIENIGMKAGKLSVLKTQVQQLGGHIEDFFSRNITHLITDQSIPILEQCSTGKENDPNAQASSSKALYILNSPIKLKTRPMGDIGYRKDIVIKAASYGVKIWNSNKLDSVLSRCLGWSSSNSIISSRLRPQPRTPRDLEHLLTKEKNHGPTDRDSTQKRHDFRYFSRGSCFVLVEDMHHEVATIAVHEYPLLKERNDKAKSRWPILYCHPQARGPFVAFDEKEKQRWERAHLDKKKVDVVNKNESSLVPTKATAQIPVKSMGDLRRSVSLNNLHKRMVQLGNQNMETNAEGDNLASAKASGYLPSGAGYMAASGNSVTVTSTTGTASVFGHTLRHSPLPSAIDGQIKRQIVTSRKFPSNKSQTEKPSRTMGPPSVLPNRPPIKKSKSTNTLRLPRREEGTKPGYCESCRIKFDDFKVHIMSSKHRRFAKNDNNFLQLDAILVRVQRRRLQEALSDELRRQEQIRKGCEQDY